MTKDEVLKQALEALEEPHPGVRTSFTDAITYREKIEKAVIAIKEALAQPEQEPPKNWTKEALRRAGFDRPARTPKRQPLSDELIDHLGYVYDVPSSLRSPFARAIELHHGIGDKT